MLNDNEEGKNGETCYAIVLNGRMAVIRGDEACEKIRSNAKINIYRMLKKKVCFKKIEKEKTMNNEKKRKLEI